MFYIYFLNPLPLIINILEPDALQKKPCQTFERKLLHCSELLFCNEQRLCLENPKRPCGNEVSQTKLD